MNADPAAAAPVPAFRRRMADLARYALAGVTRRLRDTPPVPIPPPEPLAHAPWDVLAAKVLFSHARNRQQLLGPPPTAFGQLDVSQLEILLGAAVTAASAAGTPGDAMERRLRAALSGAGLLPDDPDVLPRMLNQPPPLEDLLRAARDPHYASLFYAASLLGADRHDPAGQAWLHYLASRLRLPDSALERLHSQYGAT